MALIINIETATENASVCLSSDGEILAFEESTDQKNHASFLQPAIQKVIATAGIPLYSIDAVAVSNGPGSYTGLRVGLSAAKGLCYALDKRLVLINTLEVMAFAAAKAFFQPAGNRDNKRQSVLFCPMIDARRMEVFTALYDYELNIFKEPCAMILDEESWQSELANHLMVFSGNGCKKFSAIAEHPNMILSASMHNATHLAVLAQTAYSVENFSALAYSEPYYLKPFFTPQK